MSKILLVVGGICLPFGLFAQVNGKLQIHFMNVGQGDGAVLISPQGEIVLFDTGPDKCVRPHGYLEQLGIDHIDYHIASHYHEDHIGCTLYILSRMPLRKAAYDRGERYKSKTFTNYLQAIGNLRRTATVDEVVTLDASAPQPVHIEFAVVKGNGFPIKDENDKSIVCVVRFGQFDAIIGGDLSGYNDGGYKDVETKVTNKIGQVEVYKVNHHGSEYSSNPQWLEAIQPVIGIISCGNGNGHGHPHPDALQRLHAANVKTYWTEGGNGGFPDPAFDTIGGNIIVEVEPNNPNFKVIYGAGRTNTHTVWNPVGSSAAAHYAWSKNAKVYHFRNCAYVDTISAWNLQTNNVPPPKKTLHPGCPKLGQ